MFKNGFITPTKCSQKVVSLVILCQASKSSALAGKGGHHGGHIGLFTPTSKKIAYK